ncbi:MAG: methyltransferase [marine bacterium B5-7]|nr:MAG: methyltransferase [marine bacterium B5-7]
MKDKLYSDSRLAQFYDIDNGPGENTAYVTQLADKAESVLDLGCGTGILLASLGRKKYTVGVDPAVAMLDIACRRSGGEVVKWVNGDARNIRLGQNFDLIILTGNVFQVFLSEADQRAVLTTIATHLSSQGMFVFDTRNPTREEWRTWTPKASNRLIHHPSLGEVKAWNDVVYDAATHIATYETHYLVLSDNTLFSASSRIMFTSFDTLKQMMDDAGLVVVRWMGDWTGVEYTVSSPEIIPVGRLLV